MEDKRLYSFDELIGTIVTLSTVSLVFLALTLQDLKFYFGVASFISTLFFWVGYRIAKILHSIEIRLGIVASFFPFLFFSFILPLFEFLRENALLNLAFGLIPLGIAFVISMPLVLRVWRWLSNDTPNNWTPWDYSKERDSKLRKFMFKGNHSLPWILYGMLAGITMFFLGYIFIDLELIFLIIAAIAIWILLAFETYHQFNNSYMAFTQILLALRKSHSSFTSK